MKVSVIISDSLTKFIHHLFDDFISVSLNETVDTLMDESTPTTDTVHALLSPTIVCFCCQQ